RVEQGTEGRHAGGEDAGPVGLPGAVGLALRSGLDAPERSLVVVQAGVALRVELRQVDACAQERMQMRRGGWVLERAGGGLVLQHDLDHVREARNSRVSLAGGRRSDAGDGEGEQD